MEKEILQFHTILGNGRIVQSLQNSIQRKKISHAYLLHGIKGVGKKKLAYTFAKTIQCEQGGQEPCGHCKSCVLFEAKSHPDIFVVKPEKKTIGIDDIREKIIKNVSLKPYQFEYKIFIIEEAHTMTIQAQNALLKVLEEPPGYIVMILLGENKNSFLNTILSRCIALKVNPLPVPMITDVLVHEKNVDPLTAPVYAEYAQGSLGAAYQFMASEGFAGLREKAIQLVEKIETEDLVGLFQLAETLEKEKENIEILLDMAYIYYRDVLVSKVDEEKLIQKDQKSSILKYGSNLDINHMIKKIEAVKNAKIQLSMNANYKLAIEMMLLNIKGA